MLLLAAIAHLFPVPLTQPSARLRASHPALGHLGLAVIALIYVLLSLWQA